MTDLLPDDAMRYRQVPSPVGHLLLIGDDAAIHEIRFLGDADVVPGGEGRTSVPAGWLASPAADRPDEQGSPLDRLQAQLEQYFAGQRQSFDLPLRPEGTPFQLEVWQALREIPFGVTISYAELASRVGRPRASRAVGAANGKNPLSIVVPCHRVIGADGSLTGFGGGLEAKRTLLEHEGSVPRRLSLGQPTRGH